MNDYPKSMLEAVHNLEREKKHNVSILTVKGKYYIYETGTFVDPITKMKKQISMYLGRITEDGTIIPPTHRKNNRDIKSIEQKIDYKQEALKRENAKLNKLVTPGALSLKILGILSTDGRTSARKIARNLNISYAKAKYTIKKLEEMYGIRYTIELAPRPFGLFRYFVLAKFIGGKPDYTMLKMILETYPQIQFAAALSGEYDLFMYIFEENTQKLEDLIYEIRSIKVLAQSDSYWSVSYITRSYGFIPVRNEFIEMFKSRIWHRSKGDKGKGYGQLVEREWIMLDELNRNGRIDFEHIDKKYNLNRGGAQYTYNKLLWNEGNVSGLIERITITMDKPPIKYDSILVAEQLNIGKFNASGEQYRIHILKDMQRPTNRYILFGDIGSPYGMLAIRPIYVGEDANTAINELVGVLKDSVAIESLIIERVLLGNLGYRRIEKEYTYQYKALVEKLNYNEEKLNKI